jgi:hypothetical protein
MFVEPSRPTMYPEGPQYAMRTSACYRAVSQYRLPTKGTKVNQRTLEAPSWLMHSCGSYRVLQLVDQRQNPHWGCRSSCHFRRSDHGNGTVFGHTVEIGYIGKKIQAVLQGVLTYGQYFGRTAIEIWGIDAQAKGVPSFSQETGCILRISGKMHAAFCVSIAVPAD